MTEEVWVQPLTLDRARKFIADFHRHNKPPQGHRFSLGLFLRDDLFTNDGLVGVCVVGRPVARHLDDGVTAEVTRLCVMEHAPKGACSKLYQHAWRAWREMGGAKIVTYTLQSESGASLRGAGWVREAELAATNKCGWLNRAGRADQAVVLESKIRWSASASRAIARLGLRRKSGDRGGLEDCGVPSGRKA